MKDKQPADGLLTESTGHPDITHGHGDWPLVDDHDSERLVGFLRNGDGERIDLLLSFGSRVHVVSIILYVSIFAFN